MRRIALLTLASAALVLLAVPPAAAGGVSEFEFPRRVYTPGEVAVGRTAFDAHLRGQPRIQDGPFHAYLLPEGRWIDPPRIQAGAVRVGVVRFTGPNLEGTWFDRVAVVRFVVPDLPSGFWEVGICNDPCRDSMVGDLYGGQIAVMRTPLEGRLLYWSRRLGWRLDEARVDARRAERRLEEAESRAAAARAGLEEARAAMARLQERNADLRARLLGASAEPGAPWLPWALLPVALGAGAVLGRRSQHLVSPTGGPHAPPPDVPEVGRPPLEPVLPGRSGP